MKWKIIIPIMGFAFVACLAVTGCGQTVIRPYQTPIYDQIEANETGFLIPLTGNTGKQVQWTSLSYLGQNQLSPRRVQIPTMWVQTDRGYGDGKYVPTEQLIHVSLAPETREWTDNPETGTSTNNQGFKAETRDSNSFTARMTCSAQVMEGDAATFVHYYLGKSLADVMDSDVRNFIASQFTRGAASYDGSDLLTHKNDIMDSTKEATKTYLATRGIQLNNLGLVDDITWDNATIQGSLDAKFKATQDALVQATVNAQTVAKATADAKAAEIMASTKNGAATEYNITLQKLAIEKEYADAAIALANKPGYNGPTTVVTMGGSGNNSLMPLGGLQGITH